MANMSYCRYQNTLNDLEDCINDMEEGSWEELSQEEHNAMTSILCRMIEFFDSHGVSVDHEELQRMGEKLGIDFKNIL